MAAPNSKIVVELSPEFRTILRSIDSSLKEIAKSKKNVSIDKLINPPQPAATTGEDPQEAGR